MKIYQTLKTLFDHISKHLEVRQKYSATRRVFNFPLGVWECGQTRSFVFYILHGKYVSTGLLFQTFNFWVSNGSYWSTLHSPCFIVKASLGVTRGVDSFSTGLRSPPKSLI